MFWWNFPYCFRYSTCAWIAFSLTKLPCFPYCHFSSHGRFSNQLKVDMTKGKHDKGQVWESVLFVLSHVFNVLKVEKACSTVTTLTYWVMRICKCAEVFKKISALLLCFGEIFHIVSDILPVPALLFLWQSYQVFHIVIFPVMADSQTSWKLKPIILMTSILLTSHESYEWIVICFHTIYW